MRKEKSPRGVRCWQVDTLSDATDHSQLVVKANHGLDLEEEKPAGERSFSESLQDGLADHGWFGRHQAFEFFKPVEDEEE